MAPEKLGAYLRDLRKLLDEYNYRTAFYGHYGHGCIHMRINFDLESEAGIRRYGEFVDRAADLVVSYGGSLSGEHGDGQSRGALLPKMFGPELMKAFGEFKRAWDPGNRLNPHKVLDAYLPTENLRLGADYKPLDPKTHFQFPDDDGSFAKAALRCIGLGECRKHDSGSMCPSYMVTLEERHSTRGRAHMLFELLQGEVLRDGWKDEQVKQALDLCLSCKACKSECPANVDIATYKAEFLSHYYEDKRRPLQRLCVWHARSLGGIGVVRASAGERLKQPRGVLSVRRKASRPARAAVATSRGALRQSELSPVGNEATALSVWKGRKGAGAVDAGPKCGALGGYVQQLL